MMRLIVTSALVLSVAVPAVAQVPTSDTNPASALANINATLLKIYSLQAQGYAVQAETLATQVSQPTSGGEQSYFYCYYKHKPYSRGAVVDGMMCDTTPLPLLSWLPADNNSTTFSGK